MHWLIANRLKLAFLIGATSVGIPFWMVPYQKLNVPDALYGPGLAVVFLFALLLRATGTSAFWRTSHVMAAAVPVAVIVRVIVEVVIDPTRHNLWPLVLAIAAVVGYASAVPGAVVGHLVLRLRRAGSHDAGR